ncbi:uncharacterized protein [Nicotiana sylvestris]|uniref:uncharacterized protein n=1 Tax=Nicotiana sylvestris TaxID=4096 RepID=UPI00388C450E
MVPRDEDISRHVVEIGPDGQFHEVAVRQIWSECQYLTANTRVRDMSRGEVAPGYLAWYKKEVEFGMPAERPHLQKFVGASQEQWDWLAKENEYRATIGRLEKHVMDLQFKNSLQAAADECEKKKLTQKNEALKALIQKMRIAARNSERSRADERLISSLKKKALECQDDLEKSEANLAKVGAQWAKKAEERAKFVQQMKRKYEGTITSLKRKMTTLENEVAKKAKDFKADREHCYDLMAQMEEEMQQLQNRHLYDTQVLEAQNQQVGRLLQEKGRIRERVRVIADYIVVKCQACEDMNRTTFSAAVMTFVRQIMSDLERLQRDLAYRPVVRSKMSCGPHEHLRH